MTQQPTEQPTQRSPERPLTDTATAGPSAGPRRRWSALDVWTTVGPLAVFIALFVLVVSLRPAFLGGGGLAIVATQATAILLVALGQGMVLHVGSIDLSNAANALFCAIVLAQALGSFGGGAIVLVLVIGTVIGVLNGVLVAFFQVPSFALTLGTLGILQAAGLIVSDRTTVYAEDTSLLTPMFGTAMAGLATAFWIGVVLAVALWAMLRFTVPGQSLTAVGLNETGALFSGVRTRAAKISAFAISGLLASIAGIMIIAQAGSASSTGLGSDLLLPGITAAIVGGTAITGGITNPVNIVFGALTVTLIPIGAAALGMPSEAQSLVYGLVIIVAVALTISRRRVGIVK
ncbi:ABC transporter permease [Nakamurella leprariae]|uniref:ABC transporter permease n=1 Tax=Nakamurella leprariae TaxID=2803911 RepID=A0A939C0A1_9ACTN|nr:ABC transporter permease [Nakamurella leprariae]MBM9465957.1 ABC transporter permease [Nakamurella leprariae]